MPIPRPDDDPGASPWLLLIPGVLALALIIVLGFGAFAVFQWINVNEKRKREAKANQSKPTVVFPERPKVPRMPITVPPANEESTRPKKPSPGTVSGGVLNGKAIRLPKPEYPPSARAVHASCAVVVQVVVDEYGDVISASAVSGHQLLRAAAVSAARNAKFYPTKLSDQPVKVSGTIIYNFTE